MDLYDYVIVGGGTAGAILAARLSEDPAVTVALVEWGPSDEREDRALQLCRYPEMLGGEYDLSYPCVPSPGGNADHRLARGRILGGTSSINNMGLLPPIPADLAAWAELGVTGWDYADFAAYRDRLAVRAARPTQEQRNQCLDDALAAAVEGLSIPVLDAWPSETIREGAGYLDLGYDPETGRRSSSSVAYLHDILATRPNLHPLLESRVVAIELANRRAVGARAVRADRTETLIRARLETIVACGAIDTPRLLMLSGIGPAEHLAAVGIDPRVDLPGVGANLMDHVESLVVLELQRPADGGWPPEVDGAAFVARVDDDAIAPQVMAHLFRFAPDESYAGARGDGAELPEHTLAITPNVARPSSRGTVRLASADPDQLPIVDFRYFSDTDGHDRRTILAGIRMARRVAATAPLTDWVVREVFPGPHLQTDDELFKRIHATHGSVCHAAGTCRMGGDDDPLAVLDSRLRVREVHGLRVVDASAFPVLTTFNPMITVMMLAEHAATLIVQDRATTELALAAVTP
ncbi:GMC family oxidoreductase [Nocardioides speluncae]|uniref:GMC family oxidoreductase n=1 Tax=Nocardioides speluncae TaxID=2670337 RepID=UPI000D698FFB|nr:GMC oxidoreductase [Nocardioides speluncae]